MKIEKYQYELPSEYLKRLVRAKLNKEIDLDWSEISVLTGVEYSSESMRKISYGVRILADMQDSELEDKIENNDNEEVRKITKLLKELDDKKLELEKEKIKIQDQRREYKALFRPDARFENLVSIISYVADDMSKIVPFELKEPILKELSGTNEGVLLVSDWHYGLTIENAFNKYDTDIFRERLNQLYIKTIEHGKFHQIGKLHVFNLSDLISGIIHNTIRIQNSEDVITQVEHVGEHLATLLFGLSKKFGEIVYYDTLDNHSRIISNKKESFEKENLTRLIKWYLKVRLKRVKNIKIVDNKYGDDFIVSDVCNSKIIAVHGHNDKMANAPYDLSLMLREFPDYVFMAHGHHHEELEVHSIECIMNQSFSGVDEYAVNIRRTSKPAQKFMVFNEDGRLCTYNISLK